jgi:ADP-ribosylglycohydrolase
MHCSKEGEKHIGGLATLAPILVYYHANPQAARLAATQHLSITHLGPLMTQAAEFFCEAMAELFAGKTLNVVMHNQIATNPLLKFPFDSMLKLEDEVIVGKNFKTSCYVDHAIPCVVYLALKYGDKPETALIKNTNLGGDNCYRGAVLGALLGAAHGMSAWPERWVSGLKQSFH